MRLVRLQWGLALLLAIGLFGFAPWAHAAPTSGVSQDVGVCDPWFPSKCFAPWPDANAPISISTSTTTQLIAAPVTTKGLYITSWNVLAGGTGTFQLVYGTQTTNPCDTGQTTITGAYALSSSSPGIADGGMIPVPKGKQVCAITVGAVQYSGRIAYISRQY